MSDTYQPEPFDVIVYQAAAPGPDMDLGVLMAGEPGRWLVETRSWGQGPWKIIPQQAVFAPGDQRKNEPHWASTVARAEYHRDIALRLYAGRMNALTALSSDLYVIESMEDGETVYWMGDHRWTTLKAEALRIGGYNVAVPIAGVLGLVVGDRKKLVQPISVSA